MNLPRRFYKEVTTIAQDGGFALALDGRVPKTPATRPLILPTKALAEAIAAEWDAQEKEIDFNAMPLTRLANVALDRTPETREGLVEEVVRYCETDLLCHLADTPRELVARQDEGWTPVRNWAARELGVRLTPVTGVMAVRQPEGSLNKARELAEMLDDFRLTALTWATSTYGSALLALALMRGRLSASDAFRLSRIDEDWQIEQWGEDEEASAFAALKERDSHAIGAWFEALQ